MSDDQQNDTYPEGEAQRRFEALIRNALTTPAEPKKDIPRQRPYRPASTAPLRKLSTLN